MFVSVPGSARLIRCWAGLLILCVLYVYSANNELIGKITKQWSGLGRELFTDADYFSVTFPLSLDVRMKALLFAAVFLIVSAPCQF